MTKTFHAKRILVIGSWAKEEITIENIKKKKGLEVYAYIDTPNPGIIARADGYRLGSLYQVDDIVEYARQCRADLTIVTTAAPLAAGLVNRLEEKKMPVFGPTKEAARLEWDKAFTRELLEKHIPQAIPRFKVCKSIDEAVEFAKELDWQVAVKPTGLTDGLGVKVAGIQLDGQTEIIDYIKEIHENEISGNSRVIVEEKMTGEEFTIQCLVYKDMFIPTPAVQDFKKRDNGEKGPNTASMGSYSDASHLLPFMNNDDYEQAVRIVKKTLSAFKKETDEWCNGILYGQFMLCADGVKLVEYNFRPGDPEWMNTVSILQDNLAPILEKMITGQTTAPNFLRWATVCKYIVPPAYPYKMNEPLDVSLDSEALEKLGVKWYWSCGQDRDGKITVGTERGIALLAQGKTIDDANRKIEKAVAAIDGDFYYRSDVGSREIIKSKIDHIYGNCNAEITTRTGNQEDFLPVHNFVSACPPLENYAEHVYKILLRNFGDTCFIAEARNRIVGWVLGFFSQTHDIPTYFLWQIGVAPFMQGFGIGKQLLADAEHALIEKGCKRIELTIDPVNTPSQKLFEALGYRNISDSENQTVTVAGNTAVKDFYRPNRHFMLYEKILAPGE